MKANTQAALKRELVKSYRSEQQAYGSLMRAVKACAKAKVTRETMLEWLTDAGFERNAASKRISIVLCEAGIRDRAKGGGRKSKFAKQGKELLAYAVKKYGEDAPGVLTAAWRLSKK